MRNGFLWRIVAIVLITLVLPRVGQTQELAGSFDQLRVLVRQGERIRVTDTRGTEVSGTVVDLGPSTLSLLVSGARRDFSEAEITTIRARRSDSVANGAAWGLGVGAGVGLYIGLALASGEENPGALVPIVTAVYGGIGAGIGVGVDALIMGQRVIYAKRSARLKVVPQLKAQRQGLFLAVTF